MLPAQAVVGVVVVGEHLVHGLRRQIVVHRLAHAVARQIELVMVRVIPQRPRRARFIAVPLPLGDQLVDIRVEHFVHQTLDPENAFATAAAIEPEKVPDTFPLS